MTSRSRVRTSAVAATAVAASAALLAGATLGPTAIQSAQPERTLVADPTLAASHSIAGGVAIDPESIVKGIPDIGGFSWNLVAPLLGETTAIAVLPGSFAASLASKGESATSFAMLGVAVATTDVNVKIPLLIGTWDINIPTGQLACLGALTFATSSTEGACLNILGVLDAAHSKDNGEYSVALTNPLALLIDGIDAGKIISGIVAGESLSKLLTSDFVRLTVGGDDFVKLTSDYAFQQYKNSGGGVVIGWLGGSVVMFPVVGSGALATVNYLGLPKFDFDGFPDISNIGNIIPSLSFGDFKTPIPGVNIPAWSTGDLLGSTAASTSQRAASASDSIPEAESLSVNVPEVSAKSTAPESAPDSGPVETAPSVPEVQPEPEVEPTVTPEPVDPPVAVESTPEVETPSVTESAPDTSGLDGVDDAA